MVIFKHKGNFKRTDKFLKRVAVDDYIRVFEKYGREGVATLASVTPKDTGKTGQSWRYDINHTKKGITLTWSNTNTSDGVPVVILLEYGHATRSGGFVQGQKFINPAMKPLLDKMIPELWKEVRRL